jgi:hypothetical protein
MEGPDNIKVNKTYFYMIILLMLVLPVISIIINYHYHQDEPLMLVIGKWFTFWAIGLRLLLAGLRQTIKPAFTAKEIFNLEGAESFVIVRELGFANLCFGLIGSLSLFMPEWRSAAAFTGGLYMGIAGIYHIIKKPEGFNEIVAMVSDIFIFLVLALYLYFFFTK